MITWSFFVLCTPIAVAISINVIALAYFTEYYQTTLITNLIKVILATPFPYWSVIVLSGFGTFLSIRFGDELTDVLNHKDRYFYLRHQFKHELVLFVFFLIVLFGYYEIMTSLGISLDSTR